jgi:hypothetical protein
MKKINKETFSSPQAVFILYIIAAALVIMGYTFIFPGEKAPIAFFSLKWRLIRGCVRFLSLVPALACAALVIPFGIAAGSGESYGRFSPKFLERLKNPIVTAIIAVALYGLLFFLVLPLAEDAESNMRFAGGLYREARQRAELKGREGDWREASQFIGLCERIWPFSPEMAALKTEAAIHLEETRFREGEQRPEAGGDGAAFSVLPGQPRPVTASEALALAGESFNKERYFESHWLAGLAGRLAKDGSPEQAQAVHMASRAWNAVESLAPNSAEKEAYAHYRLKYSGFQALEAGDWIRAYYIFLELMELTPGDPDAAGFFALSEKGTKEEAFFTDEMDMALGDILTGAVFSLPATGAIFSGPGTPASGRGVLRFSSLSTFADYSYGLGLEYMAFNGDGRPLFRVEAPYAKIVPLRTGNDNRVMVLMRALDRRSGEDRWDPVWTAEAGAPADRAFTGNTMLALELTYDQFLLLADVRRGLTKLSMGQLFSASRSLAAFGYIPQVFEAEILNRFGYVLFFLPMTIFSITLGWRCRAKKRPRYIFVPMLPVLPLVFSGLILLYRNLLNTIGIWLVLSLGFPLALPVFIAGIAAIFILLLILLAAQRG